MLVIYIFFLILLLITFSLNSRIKSNSKIEKFNNNNDINYLFWTGGYDSTYRLCDLVIIQKKRVQPIYISDEKVDDIRGLYNRKNVNLELKSMKNIKQKIIQKFPYTQELILPFIDYKKVKLDSDILKTSNDLYNQNKLPRPINQYASMAQISRDLKVPIDVCVENHSHSKMRKVVIDSLKKSDNNYYIDSKNKELEIYKNMRFPTIYITKNEMLENAKKYNYDDVLYLTISCWFPKNDKPCGKCPMCLDRII